MSNNTVRQHFVPCVLLSRFGEGQGRAARVWVWDKVTGEVRRSSVNAVAYQNDLYTLPQDALDQIDEPDWFPEKYRGPRGWESMLQDLEGMFGELLDDIERTLTLPPARSDALDDVLRMLVLLELRTPTHMEVARQQAELLHNICAEIEANNRPELRENGEIPRLVVPFKENKHILFAQAMTHWVPIVMLQHERNWSLWVSNEHDFVITDFPVSRSFARRPAQAFDSPAPATPNTLYMLPLGRHLMLAGDDGLGAATRVADGRVAGYHNTLALHNADRFIYTYADSFEILWYEGNPPAYQAMRSADSYPVGIDAARFAEFVQQGLLAKPKRWGVHGADEFEHLIPPENRLSTEDLLREADQNSS